MDRFSVLVLIYNFLFYTVVCSKSPAFQTNFQITKNFGQNLAEPINQVLHEANSSKHKTILKEALTWSPVVYYVLGKFKFLHFSDICKRQNLYNILL